MQIICRKDLLAQHLQTIRQLCPNHLKEFCNLGEKPMVEKGGQPDVGLLVKKIWAGASQGHEYESGKIQSKLTIINHAYTYCIICKCHLHSQQTTRSTVSVGKGGIKILKWGRALFWRGPGIWCQQDVPHEQTYIRSWREALLASCFLREQAGFVGISMYDRAQV